MTEDKAAAHMAVSARMLALYSNKLNTPISEDEARAVRQAHLDTHPHVAEAWRKQGKSLLTQPIFLGTKT
jgi:hypothetical protein